LEISDISLIKPIASSSIWTTWAFTGNFSESHIRLIVNTTKNKSWGALKFTKFSIGVHIDLARYGHIGII